MNLKVLFLFILISLNAFASKVTCNSLFSNDKEDLSNSSFIPLSVFIASEKDVYAIRSWMLKRGVKSIGPGVGIMYQTANQAAEKVKKSLNLNEKKVYVFDKFSGSIIDDFAKVVDVMRTRKYEYIQNAMIISPEGVYTVLPLAKYDAKADTYVPIVIKGHQELEKKDILTAVLTSYAIAPYMSGPAKTAKVALRPIVPIRKQTNINESEHLIYVENSKVQIKKIYENFVEEYQKFSKELEENYSKFFTENPKASDEEFLSSVIEPLLKASEIDLTQMPYSPSTEQLAVLERMGYKTKEEIAAIDLNSNEFVKVSLAAQVAPYRLKYFILRSRATVENKIILTQEYEDPGLGIDYAVHFDIEAVYEPEIKSGAYYFGVEIQSQKKIGEPVKEYVVNDKNPSKFFIGGFQELTQENIDKAWVDFLMLLKTDKRLKNGNYLIPVYSAYEQVKMNQIVDIRKDKIENFTAEEKKSSIKIAGKEYSLYREFEVYEPYIGIEGQEPRYVKKGYLIRRLDLFEKHPEINPDDIFTYHSKLYDMLPFFRHKVANPTNSNGLKSLLTPIQDELPESVQKYYYGNGDNGLNCIAWYYQYIRTGDPEILERIRLYLELDIRANRIFWNFIRTHAGEKVELRNTFKPETLAILKEGADVFEGSTYISNLRAKEKAFRDMLNVDLNDLEDDDIINLAQILNRSSYLDERELVKGNKRMGAERIKAILMHSKNDFEMKRKNLLLEFIKSINPKINTEAMSKEAEEALAFILSLPSNQLSKQHLNRILVIEQLEAELRALIQELNIKPLDGQSLSLETILSELEPELLKRKFDLKAYRLIKYNEVDVEKSKKKAKVFGFGDDFEKYLPVSFSKIWKGLFLEYLLSDFNKI